ncbi:MAG TPA: hypothetical protein VL738_43780 [Dactylosporangium sp.]|nr:hypothetical protein [Dactylosporangium sp.]
MVRRSVVPLLVLLLLPAACARPGESAGYDSHAAQVEQAHAALERWAAAASADGPPFVAAGEQTGQTGNWEPGVGDAYKQAMLAGAVEVAGTLPTQTPPPGEIRWADGNRRTVDVLPAAETLQRLREAGSGQCAMNCPPIPVTGATLATANVSTSRGPAVVPAWQFTVRDSAVRIWRVAVATKSPEPGPHDPNNPPAGLSAERATIHDRTLTVYFTGAGGSAAQPCGADYSAEVIASDIAVVVLVLERNYEPPAGSQNYGCDAVGYPREASVQLTEPLGDRVVLEVRYGTAIPVTQV